MASKNALGHTLSKKKGNSSVNEEVRHVGNLNSDIQSQVSKANQSQITNKRCSNKSSFNNTAKDLSGKLNSCISSGRLTGVKSSISNPFSNRNPLQDSQKIQEECAQQLIRIQQLHRGLKQQTSQIPLHPSRARALISSSNPIGIYQPTHNSHGLLNIVDEQAETGSFTPVNLNINTGLGLISRNSEYAMKQNSSSNGDPVDIAKYLKASSSLRNESDKHMTF